MGGSLDFRNILSSNTVSGLDVNTAANTTVSFNAVTLNGGNAAGDAGVRVTTGANITALTDNFVSANKGDGVRVVDSTATTLTLNRIGASDDGLTRPG